MSNPVHDLQRLIASGRPTSGRVVSVAGLRAVVATPTGQIEAAHDGSLAVGDVVTIIAGRAVKRQRSGGRVYQV